jgi:hypothetical protein
VEARRAELRHRFSPAQPGYGHNSARFSLVSTS